MVLYWGYKSDMWARITWKQVQGVVIMALREVEKLYVHLLYMVVGYLEMEVII